MFDSRFFEGLKKRVKARSCFEGFPEDYKFKSRRKKGLEEKIFFSIYFLPHELIFIHPLYKFFVKYNLQQNLIKIQEISMIRLRVFVKHFLMKK